MVNLLCVFLYFYLILQARHHIISLLIDRCADPDKRTRKFACFAVRNVPFPYNITFMLNLLEYCYLFPGVSIRKIFILTLGKK